MRFLKRVNVSQYWQIGYVHTYLRYSAAGSKQKRKSKDQIRNEMKHRTPPRLNIDLEAADITYWSPACPTHLLIRLLHPQRTTRTNTQRWIHTQAVTHNGIGPSWEYLRWYKVRALHWFPLRNPCYLPGFDTYMLAIVVTVAQGDHQRTYWVGL